jgi:CspA family cold shock protein
MRSTEVELSLGRVKWFSNSKGYGFLLNEDDEDVFVHHRAILTDADYKTLQEGEQVEFIQVKSAKGWQAAEVRPIPDLPQHC